MGYHACVALLLEAGGDLNKVGRGGLTPLQLAEDNNHLEIAKLIRTHAETNGVELRDCSAPQAAKEAWPVATEDQLRESFKNDLGGEELQTKLLTDLGMIDIVEGDLTAKMDALLAKIRVLYAEA